MPIALSGCASTRVYIHGAADGWIFLRSYLDFSYVRTGSDECIYDTSIIEVVDVPYLFTGEIRYRFTPKIA